MIVDEDGNATRGLDTAAGAELLREARGVIERLGPGTSARPLDDATRRALQELGYAE